MKATGTAPPARPQPTPQPVEKPSQRPKPTHAPARAQPSTDLSIKPDEIQTPAPTKPRYTYVIPERTNQPTRSDKQDNPVASGPRTEHWKPKPTKAPARAGSNYDSTVRLQQAERTTQPEAKIKPEQSVKRERPEARDTSSKVKVKPEPTKAVKPIESPNGSTVSPRKKTKFDNTNKVVTKERDNLVTPVTPPKTPGDYSVPRETISSAFCLKITWYLFPLLALHFNA